MLTVDDYRRLRRETQSFPKLGSVRDRILKILTAGEWATILGNRVKSDVLKVSRYLTQCRSIAATSRVS